MHAFAAEFVLVDKTSKMIYKVEICREFLYQRNVEFC